ncbi:MAG: CHAT domain-containing protein, partial [Cyanobacteria bacterium J083]
ILGNYQKAIVFQQQSLEIEIFLKNDARAAYSYNTLGAIYAHLGNYERAITQYEQAIAKSSQNNLLKGQIYHNLAAVYHQNRNFRQAINYYQQAEKIAQQINNSSLEGTAIAGIGLAYATAGNYNQAIPYQKRSIELARLTGDRKLEATALSNLSYTLWQRKKYSEAEKNLESALDILESLRLGLSDLDQVSLADTQFRSYDLLKRVLIAQNQPEKALEIAERGRSQAFIRLLSGRSINQRNLQSKQKNQAKLTANFTFQPREKLNFKKQSKQKEFDKSRSIISNNLNSSLLTPYAEFKLIASTWGNPQPNRNNQVKPINRSQRNSSSSSESISINEIRQVAQQQNATLVEYALLPDADFIGQGKQTGKYTEIYIWVVKPTGEINFRRTKLQPEDFNLQGAQEITRDQATLQKLHQLLIEPIADLLPSKPTEKIILIPHREIFLVPFPALQDSQANYLIQRHTILTSPAIKVLQLTQKNQTSNPDNNNYLIIGNPTNPVTVSTPAENPYRLDLVPLPGAEAEAKAIAQILQTQALIGDDATETKVKKLISSANLVHIAAHGLLDDFFSTGLPGAIILAADSQNDGALTSDEILELDIKADLVIISACDTG